MGAIFNPPKPKVPKVPPPPPVERDIEPEVQQARDRRRRTLLAAVGRASTILTGPLGLTGDATIGRKTLLGQ